MKKLLLTSAIVAVAGGAAAEVTWSGDVSFGYKSHYKFEKSGDPADGQFFANTDDVTPIYYEGGINAEGSSDLGNGVTASLNYNLTLADYDRSGDVKNDGTAGAVLDHGFPTLTVEAPVGKLTLGDAEHAAKDAVSAPFEANAGLTEAKDDLVLRGDITYSGVDAGLSYVVADDKDSGDKGLNKDSYTLGVKGEFSGAKFGLGYETNNSLVDNIDDASAFGINVGYTAMGINGMLYYGSKTEYDAANKEMGYTSFGLTADYTMSTGAKLGAEYSMNSTDKDGGFGKDKDGNDYDSYNAYKVWVGFEAMGADITAGYKNKHDVNSQFDNKTNELGVAGIFIDAAYEISGTGVTVIGGYDQTDAIVAYEDVKAFNDTKAEERYGAFYIGTKYEVNDNATVMASYSNGNEINPDEDFAAGASLGVKLSF